MIPASRRRRVAARAGFRCEYCRLAQQHEPFVAFHIEHIRPKKHLGDDSESNLCLACSSCNLRKGPNLAGIDPRTGVTVPLFHPRKEEWESHFRWAGAHLRGRTPTGRATIAVLGINLAENVEHREALIAEGVFP